MKVVTEFIFVWLWLVLAGGYLFGAALDGGSQRKVTSDVIRLLACLLMALGNWIRNSA